MLRYSLQRLLTSLLTLFVIASAIFLMLRIIPGDPAQIFAGENATAEDVERVRRQLNLDKPLVQQYGMYLADLARGDLGTSMRSNTPVLEEIGARLPSTISLAVLAMVIAVVIGVPAGVLAALKRHSLFDTIASTGTLIGVAMPVYWLGLMLIVVFAVKLNWLPAAGSQDGLKSMILPAITLASFSMALITRMTRASVLEVMTQEYITTARAKGQRERMVIYRHMLRNALIPVVTVVGLQFGSLLGGSILTETIFAWPGIGRLLTQSLLSRDYPIVQGIILIFAALFILVNYSVDLLYAVIDPRIKYE